jgi:hypothetical protein
VTRDVFHTKRRREMKRDQDVILGIYAGVRGNNDVMNIGILEGRCSWWVDSLSMYINYMRI